MSTESPQQGAWIHIEINGAITYPSGAPEGLDVTVTTSDDNLDSVFWGDLLTAAARVINPKKNDRPPLWVAVLRQITRGKVTHLRRHPGTGTHRGPNQVTCTCPASLDGTVTDPDCPDGRCYAPTQDTKTHEILDMSYIGYNAWREELARAIHRCEPERIWRNKDTSLAMYEIINFSDCEGYIGLDAASDLLKDFTDDYLRDRYQRHLDASDDTWVKSLASVWDSWVAGLRLAVDGGLIRYA